MGRWENTFSLHPTDSTLDAPIETFTLMLKAYILHKLSPSINHGCKIVKVATLGVQSGNPVPVPALPGIYTTDLPVYASDEPPWNNRVSLLLKSLEDGGQSFL